MNWWAVGLGANAVISVAYFAITAAILVPLIRSGQLKSNPLGGATGAIFLTCAVHHGVHAVHMTVPFFEQGDPQGLAMRSAWTWQLALWDVVGAVVALYYWTLRRNYGSLMKGAQLFEDLRQREQQALELNDNVLQGLVVAKMSLDLGDHDRARAALDIAIGSASHMVTDLLGVDGQISPKFQRGEAAVLQPPASAESTPVDADATSPPTREQDGP